MRRLQCSMHQFRFPSEPSSSELVPWAGAWCRSGVALGEAEGGRAGGEEGMSSG